MLIFIIQLILNTLFFKFIFNSTSDGLQDYYPLDILPNEWGGKAGTMEELNGKCFSTS